MLRKVFLLEQQKEFKKAVKLIKEIKLLITANDNSYEMDETEKRLLAKKELLSPKKKGKSKKDGDKKKKKN